MNRFTLSLLASSAIALGTTVAFAAPIALGTTTTASYTSGTFVPNSFIGGTTQATSAGGDPNPFTVNYNENIYRGGTGAMCSSCLDFVFNFANVATVGTDPILEFTIASFNGYLVSADYVAGSGTQAPTQALMTVNGVLNYGYDGNTGVLPGQSSDTLVVYTNATSFTSGGLTFQDGATANDPGFVPAGAAAVTPEPNSLVLLGTGLVSVAGFARRKFRM